ncbi:TetR/AcrR family transcriptional regulator [Granulicoccus phenolivorans]|uniref:TetR/AcrR family transcriptional regulator n=1 Tax=Granulicoccus phenolivorans TaxID=266854 RepID=UPI0004211308|nr:TetR/AcrR family transcriptional regulator [Granulicoccus phenolivorans]
MQECGGLRERQRRETYRLLHEAALALAEEGGLAAASIDAITKRAGVSRRTFFNYFAAKEDALLGIAPIRVPEEELDALVAAGPSAAPLTRMVRLLQTIFGNSEVADKPFGWRRELLQRFPELAWRQRQIMLSAQEQVLQALARRLSDAPGESGESGADAAASAEYARALVLLAVSVLGFMHSRNPADLDGAHPEAIESAIAGFRDILRDEPHSQKDQN